MLFMTQAHCLRGDRFGGMKRRLVMKIISWNKDVELSSILLETHGEGGT